VIPGTTVISVADPDPESGAFLTPGSGDVYKIRIRIRIGDEQPGSYFQELRHSFLVKILKFFAADPESFLPWIRYLFYPGSGIREEKIRI
jgi:hypothetical protein